MSSDLIAFLLKQAGKHINYIGDWITEDGEVIHFHLDELREILNMLGEHMG